MLKLKRSAIKYKDANGAMQDLGAVVGTQTPDAVLSETSTNCVQNKVVAEKFADVIARIVGLEESSSSEPGSVVQADYNQNDSEAPDFIKNRPCYTADPVENTLLNNISVTINSANGYVRSDTVFEIKAGQTYRVIFDGTEYECEVHSVFGENVIGNGAIAGASGGNNEPFLLVNNYSFIYAASAGTHTITLVEIYEEVVQLPEKYIAYKPGKTVEEKIHAEIFNDYSANVATGDYSHAEGSNTEALGNYSHAEGNNTTAEGAVSHAEGSYTTASGDYSHAEGRSTTASGTHSHAQGYETNATGNYSHAEGQKATASGSVSHAQGYNTVASGDCSYAEGWCTKAASKNQHVQGKFNVEDTSGTYAHIVGNGTSDTARSNAHTVDWNGNAWFAGDVQATDESGNTVSLLAIKAWCDSIADGRTMLF